MFDKHHLNHIYDSAGKRQSLKTLLQGKDNIICNKRTSNKFGRSTQGNIHGVTSTDTMDFIHEHEVPCHQ